MDKDLQHELEKYKILYTAYADEIGNLWKRSIFLATFMTLAWGGYGALQLKRIEKDFTITNLTCNPLNLNVYHCVSLGLCAIIIILSLLWVAMAKGSKFVQEAHEKHIENFIENDKDLKKLYCNLKDYEYLNLSDNLFWFGVLGVFRYSPSKINIALGWISCLLGGILFIVHIASIFCEKWCCIGCIAIVALPIVLAMFFCFKNAIKGENTTSKAQNEGVG